jgi:cytochrome P450
LINILTHYPNVQKTLRDKVDRVVGASRLPSIRDRDAMPYACATILELLRFTNVVPTLVHETLEDTTVGGYAVPAGTKVVPLFWALHHDESYWGDPWVFRPERFLDDGGRLVTLDHTNRKHLMAFGSGLRVCGRSVCNETSVHILQQVWYRRSKSRPEVKLCHVIRDYTKWGLL